MAQGHGVRRTSATLDTLLALEASNTETASANSTTIIDLGGGDQSNSPMFHGDMQVDVSAIKISATDETYHFILEGSSSATFASDIEELAALQVGDGSTLIGNTDVDSDTGRYVVPFANERNGRSYRYIRLAWVIAGTSPSITFKADVNKRVGH